MTNGRLDSGVVHVLHSLNTGGAELRTIELVNSTDLKFDFLCTSGASGSLAEAVEADGHTVTSIRLSPRHVPALVRYLREPRRVVVHSHIGIASGPIMLLAWLSGVPRRITHFRSDAVGGRRRVLKTIALHLSRQLVDRFATHLVGVSPGSLSSAWRADWRDDHRCLVIPNGIDTADLRRNPTTPGPADQLTLVHVGRSDPAKNRERVLTIWSRLAERRPTRLVMIGRMTEDEHAMVLSVESHTAHGSAEVLGDVSHEAVGSNLAAADVTLVPSRREGLPGVVLESLAVGTPVVASRLPGAEWIADNVCGVSVCDLSDSDDTWCEAIEHSAGRNRTAIKDDFDSGPFVIDRVTPRFLDLWAGK